jgi:hypothetical protein
LGERSEVGDLVYLFDQVVFQVEPLQTGQCGEATCEGRGGSEKG